MSSVSVEKAQSNLAELIDQLSTAGEVIITKDDHPVARLVAVGSRDQSIRRLGTLHGTVTYISPDFDAPLEDFREYMD